MFALRSDIGQIGHQLFIITVSAQYALDGQLLVLGNVNVLDLVELEELLFVAKHFTEEVLVQLFIWRKVPLGYVG